MEMKYVQLKWVFLQKLKRVFLQLKYMQYLGSVLAIRQGKIFFLRLSKFSLKAFFSC